MTKIRKTRKVTTQDIEDAIARCPEGMPIGAKHHLCGWANHVLIIVTRDGENSYSVTLR
jgi:hypothetical protein